ncbi:hypothetical protein ACGFK1_16050 [Mycobacterium sp. NPDC048908]|uniref:hypothetical protein n=1 Tax=Mycobacterium sp. NPDC048908 TaxID=3364292 RepID=UPI00370F8072
MVAKKSTGKKTPPKKAVKAAAKETPVARKAASAKKAALPKEAPAAPKKVARRPRLGNPDADPAKIHRDYVERYIGGGGEPTEGAYADGLQRAYADGLRQWRNLPGAVSFSASVIEQPDSGSGEPDPDQDQ